MGLSFSQGSIKGLSRVLGLFKGLSLSVLVYNLVSGVVILLTALGLKLCFPILDLTLGWSGLWVFNISILVFD